MGSCSTWGREKLRQSLTLLMSSSLTYILPEPGAWVIWDPSCHPLLSALKTPHLFTAPSVGSPHSYWSRLGGLRSWSAITLAEKLYKFNMFWKKESSDTSYYGNGKK